MEQKRKIKKLKKQYQSIKSIILLINNRHSNKYIHKNINANCKRL
jgi:hypothetical protein